MSIPSSTFTENTAGLVTEGQVLVGKYRVERVLGVGGMGVVVAATHLQLEEQVAIKLLLPEAARTPGLSERFLREARAAVKIKSEHVARVTDVGTLETGTPYMVMEYLAGSDLADVVKAGPLPVASAVDYVLQACEALAEAHAAGIVHRDLKPANLFLTRRADGSPCVKVLDFGISKITRGSSSDARMTDTKAVMGSPLYMSPEQLKSSRDVDARTDIWALGAILYELLTGAPPFDAETVPQLCMQIIQGSLPPLSEFRGDVAPALEAAIRRCLEKSPDHRFHHVGELAEALAPHVSGRARLSAERVVEIARASGFPARVEAASAPADRTTGAGQRTSASWGGTLATRRKRPGAIAIAAIAACVLLIGAAVPAVLRSRDRSNAVTTEPPAALTTQPAAPTTQPAAPATQPPSVVPLAMDSEPPAPAQAGPTAATAEPASTAAPRTRPMSAKVSAPSTGRSEPSPGARTTHPAPTPHAPGDGNLFDDRK